MYGYKPIARCPGLYNMPVKVSICMCVLGHIGMYMYGYKSIARCPGLHNMPRSLCVCVSTYWHGDVFMYLHIRMYE